MHDITARYGGKAGYEDYIFLLYMLQNCFGVLRMIATIITVTMDCREVCGDVGGD